MAIKDRLVEIIYDLKDKFSGKIGAITSGIRNVEKASDASADRIDANTKRMSASFGSVGGILSKISLGTVVFAATVGKAVGSIKEWIGLANVQERAEVKLATSLKNLTGASEEQIQALKDQAAALQEVTGYGDEQTISAQAMLATFRLTADEVAVLTPRLLDMAEAQRKAGKSGVDLETISIAVGKALTGGISSLSRYGVAMEDAQKEAFKLADQQGKVAIIAEVLDGNFKGLAATVGGEYEGSVRKSDAAHGDFLETLGRLFTQNKAWIKLSEQSTNAWKKAAEGIEGSTENINLVISSIAKSLAITSHIIRSLWNEITIVFRVGAASITESVALITQSLSLLTFGDASRRLKQFSEDMRGTTREILKGVGGDFEDIQDSYNTMLKAFDTGDSQVKRNTESLGSIGSTAKDAAAGTDELTEQTKKLTESLKGAETAANKEIDELEKAGDSAEETKNKFDTLIATLNGEGLKTSGFTLLNAVDALSSAREKLRDGDYSGALEDADRIGGMLLDIKESGAAADITIRDLSEQLREVVQGATEGQVKKELIDAEDAISEVDALKAKIRELEGDPVKLKVEVDDSQLEQIRQIDVVEIPYKYVLVGGQPIPESYTGLINELYNESDKKGFRP